MPVPIEKLSEKVARHWGKRIDEKLQRCLRLRSEHFHVGEMRKIVDRFARYHLSQSPLSQVPTPERSRIAFAYPVRTRRELTRRGCPILAVFARVGAFHRARQINQILASTRAESKPPAL